jgi:peptidoglycan hydrolase-like protein with peptidoglycan-binding domain
MIRNLLLGSKGLDVKLVQDALNDRRRGKDPMLVPDGDFGRHTRDAVVAFQQRVGLDPDGIVGYHTRKALFPLLGFTTYRHVTRSRGDYPGAVAARAPALVFTAKDLKIKVLAAGGLKAKGVAGGDVPDPDPSPVVPWLPPLTDPFFAPTKPLGLNGFSIPVPSLPESLFGMPQDQAQVQAGGQFTTRHLWESKPGSPNPSLAAVFSLQQVYLATRTKTAIWSSPSGSRSSTRSWPRPPTASAGRSSPTSSSPGPILSGNSVGSTWSPRSPRSPPRPTPSFRTLSSGWASSRSTSPWTSSKTASPSSARQASLEAGTSRTSEARSVPTPRSSGAGRSDGYSNQGNDKRSMPVPETGEGISRSSEKKGADPP